MERVLVTGATGFIGVELIRELADRGIRPRILVRRPHRAALLASYDVEPIQGDLRNRDTLRRAVEGVDTVIHLGGRASFESYKRIAPTIVDSTVALGEAAAEAGVERFVFASSLFVHGSQKEPITADTIPTPRLDYGRAKLEAEDGLEAISQSSGMAVASLRFPHVYGPQSILFKQVQSGYALFPGRMANRCGQLHVEDAARILVAAAETGWSGRSAVADSRIVDWIEYFEVLQAVYPYFRLLTLPNWLGYTGAVFLEPVMSWEGRPTLYTKDTVVGFNLDLPVEPGLVWSEVGIEPRYPSIHEGIPAALDGYVHYRWRHPLLDHRRP